MHELGIATDILNVSLAEAQNHGARRITGVSLLVGVLRGIVPEHLIFLFGHIAKGTIAEGAMVSIEEDAVRVECKACGTFEARKFALECPACKKMDVLLTGGDALRIVSLEIDE